jgi:hypothetical protein
VRRGEARRGVNWSRGRSGRGAPRRVGWAAAAMACGGATGARVGARPGSRRSGAGAGRGEAVWNAKNHSGVAEDGRRGTPCGDPRRRKGHWRQGGLRQEFDGG